MGRSPPPTMKQRRKQRTRKPTATAARPANDKSTSIAKFKRYGENSISTDCKKQRNLPIWCTPVPQIRRVLALDGANLAVRVPVPRSIYPRTGHFAPKGPSNSAVSVKCHKLTPNSSSPQKSEQNGVFKMQKNLHMTCLWPPPPRRHIIALAPAGNASGALGGCKTVPIAADRSQSRTTSIHQKHTPSRFYPKPQKSTAKTGPSPTSKTPPASTVGAPGVLCLGRSEPNIVFAAPGAS